MKITNKQAAVVLGVSRQRIHKLVKDERLKSLNGKIEKKSVLKYKEQRKKFKTKPLQSYKESLDHEYTVYEITQKLGCSEVKVYDLINNGFFERTENGFSKKSVNDYMNAKDVYELKDKYRTEKNENELTRVEAAKYLGVSVGWLNELRKKGEVEFNGFGYIKDTLDKYNEKRGK